MTQPKRNHLSGEHSPYLLQHSDNPVAWYPWGSEAFDVAAREGKPVFLSIGYATCHWCHVMEKESFKDQEVAALLNQDFISVKVDREELPHVDQVYMTAAQLMTQGGGWPLTLFLTPDRKPFYAGTYFPKNQKWGKPGLMELLPQIAQLWKDDRPRVYLSANSVQKGLDQVTVLPGEVDVDKGMLRRGATRLLELHDPNYGGFGRAPKFPIPHNLLFLMRYAHRNGDKKVLEVVKTTLDGMASGGIQDQLGGGFHRYSVDEKWQVPHFEKMLYDQALLLMAYSEMAQISGERRYAEVAEGIVSYVSKHLTSPEGAFFSAEDADSDGGEGNFYVWTREEVVAVLGEQAGTVFCDFHSVTPEGNFLDPHNPAPGRNVLQRRVDAVSFAETVGMKPAALRKQMAEGRQRLLMARQGRIRPKRDEKILADWNGLMIAALAGAASRLKKPQWLAMATKAWDAVGGLLWSDSDGVLHRHFHGHSGVPGQLDDHAFMLWAAVELHQATLDEKYLKGAEFLAEAGLAWFGDGGKGTGFYMTRKGVEVPTRPQIVWDGAIPSGNSAMMLSLARLARLLGHAEWEDRVHGVLRGLSGSITQTPEGHSLALVAADYLMGPSVEVHLVYKEHAQDVLPFLKALQRQYRPNVAVARHRHMEGGYFFAPTGFSRDCGAESVAIAYACRDFSCEAPVCEPEALEAIVDGSTTGG